MDIIFIVGESFICIVRLLNVFLKIMPSTFLVYFIELTSEGLQQMLEAVNTIHEERIVHSDLKPANFLLVKGSLKLIDFGIAKAIMSDTTNIQRDSQVRTDSRYFRFEISFM